jgi:hypothetical protein
LTPLRHDDGATIAFWRDGIVRAGGIAGTLESVCELLCRGLAMPREGCRKTYPADVKTDSFDLKALRHAYAAVLARRQSKRAK